MVIMETLVEDLTVVVEVVLELLEVLRVVE